MVGTLRILWDYLRITLKSQYKWLLLLYLLWAYRVGFMPADEGGFARALQTGCLIGMAYYFNRFTPGIFVSTFKNTNKPVKYTYFLYLFATISAIWSFMPMFSAYLALQNIVLLCGMIWLFSQFDTFEEVEKSFLVFALLILLFDFVGWRVFREPWTLFSHHLTNGSSAAMIISYCVAELLAIRQRTSSRKPLLKGMLIVSIIIIVLCTSSGANASAIFGVGVGVLISGKIFWASLLFVGAFTLYLNQEMIDQLILFIMPGKTKATIETSTGRTSLWNVIYDLAAQKPWFGWGYACVERVASLSRRIKSPDAHNNYIGLYGGLGYVGSAIAYFSFATTLFYSWKRRLRPGYKGIIAAFCCALLNGYSYGFLAGKACNITVVCFALVALTYCYSIVPLEEDDEKSE